MSPTGILLDTRTPEPCRVGTVVVCDVALPNGSRQLRGRIAHTRALASARVGVGIEFVDLSPLLLAELRGVVGETEGVERVRVQFEGMRQVVTARAQRTADGFQLETALPFFRVGAAVNITSSADAAVGGSGRVRTIAFDLPTGDAVPRLLIDVRLDLDVGVPTPMAADRTEIVRMPTEPARPRRRRAAMLAGAAAFAALGIALVGGRPSAPGLSFARVLRSSAPSDVAGTGAVNRSAVARPAVASPVVAAPPAEAPAAAPIVVPEPPLDSPSEAATFTSFTVPLAGSLAGAVRYTLRAPDGVAFNLPHARTAMRIGTYTPDVAGLRTVWVRALRGGGTHLRFFFDENAATPDVELRRDAVQVIAR